MAKDKVDFVNLPTGSRLQCGACGGDRFRMRRAQLNTAMLTFLGLDEFNRSAECFICERCHHIHWFLPP